MDMSIIPDILNTGVTGFAFLMLYLGFKLTSNVQTKIFEHQPSDFRDIEMYREWKSLIASQLTNTRYFIGFSLLFFAGGLFLMLYQTKHEIKIITSPEELPFKPVVFVQGEKINFDHNSKIIMKNGESIRIDYDSARKQIALANNSLRDAKILLSAEKRKNSLANITDDSGF